jgi:hypothetical protein
MSVSAAARWARPRRWSGVVAWAVWALTMLGLAVAAWLDDLQRQAGSPETAWLLQPASIPLLVAAVSAATVGALLGSRRPAHPVGWLLLGLGLLVVANGVVSGYVNYGLLTRPGALPGAGYLAGVANGIQVLWLACVSFVLLLTPTGSLPSPRWRWWARVAAAAPVLLVLLSAVDPQPLLPEHPEVENPLAVPVPTGLLLAVAAVAALIVLASLVAAAGSLVVRFRRARGVERQQLRWLALGVVAREVVDAADGWPATEGGVGAVHVVPVDPARQGMVAGGVGPVQPLIGPLLEQGPVEPLHLPIGLWPIGSGALVVDAGVGQRGSEQAAAVADAVVGQHPGDGDAVQANQ